MAQNSAVNPQSCKMLQQQLANALRTLENAQKEFDVCKVHLAVSQASISKAQKEIESVRKESWQSKDNRSQNTAELVTAKEECASLRRTIVGMEAEINSLRKENCRLSSANRQLQESHLSLMNGCKCQPGIVENQAKYSSHSHFVTCTNSTIPIVQMTNVKQELEDPSDICSIPLADFEIPKQELMPINIEPQESSDKRSEFDLQNTDNGIPKNLRHAENGEESCSQSSEAFTTSDNLLCTRTRKAVSHSRGSHRVKKSFVCIECNKRFNLKCNLKRHKLIHTGEKPFKCKWCDKRFNQSSNLKGHERSHTGEKPAYECQRCGLSYRHRIAFATHKCSYASCDRS